MVVSTTASAIRVLEDSDDSECLQAVIDHIRSADLPPRERQQVISNVAWAFRLSDRMTHAAARVLEVAGCSDTRSVAEEFAAQLLRFDFRFHAILLEAKQWENAHTDVIASIVLFAELGAGLATEEDVDKFIASRELNGICYDIVLHGLWLATHLPNQSAKVIELADDLILRGYAGTNTYFRRGCARGAIGEYDAARQDLFTAMDMLGGRAPEVHQDYVRELRYMEMRRELQRLS